MNLCEITQEQFFEFTKKFPIKSIYQTKQYGALMRNQGYEDIYIGMFNNNNLLAATLILIKKENGFKYGYAPKGFLLNYDDKNIINSFTQLLKDYFYKKNVMGIKISPMILKNIYDFKTSKLISNPYYENIFSNLKDVGYYHLGYNNFFEALKPRFEAILELNKPLNELFKDVKKEYRTKIRSAIKNGVKVYKGDLKSLDKLYEFNKDSYNRNLDYYKDCFGFFIQDNMIDIYCTKLNPKIYLQTTQKKLSYYENESSILSSKLMSKNKNSQKIINKKINIDKYLEQYRRQLVEATANLRKNPDEIITSCAIVIKQDKEATILIDGYDKNFKKLNSKHLLIWQIIENYKKLGFSKINFGGMSNVVVDKNSFIGLNQFKMNFGSKMYEYAGDFEIITNKRTYNLYRNYVPLKKLIINKLK